MSTELKNILLSYAEATKAVRKTIDKLIDESSFVELDALIGGKNELGEYKGEGVMCGFAEMGGIKIALLAINPEVFGGGISRRGSEKIERLVNRAIQNNTPLVSVINSAGARVLEGASALYGYGLIIKSFAKAYEELPVFTVVDGKCYGMLTFLSGMCDLFISTEKSEITTASPLLITASAGDGKPHSLASELAKTNGSVTHVVKNIADARELILKAINLLGDFSPHSDDDANRVCKGLSVKTAMSKILNEVFDNGSLLEIREAFAGEVKTVLAKLGGESVAVVALEGKLTSNGADKINSFLKSVKSFDLPLVNIIDSAGIAVDYTQESANLIRSVSDVISNYCNSSLPKIAIITGEAVGAAYSIFASKNIYDFTFAFEGSSITPLESSSAAWLMHGNEITKSKNAAAAEKKLISEYESENSALLAAENGYLDNVIIPNHTRQYLIAALQTIR